MDEATRDKVNEKLRRNLKKIQKLETEGQWPKAEEELNAEFDRLNEVQAMMGDAKTKEIQKQLEAKAEQVRAEKNIKLAEKLRDEIGSLVASMARKDPNYFLAIFANIEANFDTHDWTTARRPKKSWREGRFTRVVTIHCRALWGQYSTVWQTHNSWMYPRWILVSSPDRAWLKM